MKIICHRGNTFGPDPENENKPEVIDYCIREGFDVEIDMWVVNKEMYLGHDEPQYQVDWGYLARHKDSLWIHAKNFEALTSLNNYYFNYFWHDMDRYCITSKSFIWTHPDTVNEVYNPQQVLLDFRPNVDFDFYKNRHVAGVCVDYV